MRRADTLDAFFRAGLFNKLRDELLPLLENTSESAEAKVAFTVNAIKGAEKLASMADKLIRETP